MGTTPQDLTHDPVDTSASSSPGQATGDTIALYTVLMERVKHEGTLYWTRYSAFFVVVSAFAGLTFTQLRNQPSAVPALVVVGAIINFAWVLANYDGARWQEYFNGKVMRFERENAAHLRPIYATMYDESRFRPDVVPVSIAVSATTFAMWSWAAFTYGRWAYLTVAALACLAIYIFAASYNNVLRRIGKRILNQATTPPALERSDDAQKVPRSSLVGSDRLAVRLALLIGSTAGYVIGVTTASDPPTTAGLSVLLGLIGAFALLAIHRVSAREAMVSRLRRHHGKR